MRVCLGARMRAQNLGAARGAGDDVHRRKGVEVPACTRLRATAQGPPANVSRARARALCLSAHGSAGLVLFSTVVLYVGQSRSYVCTMRPDEEPRGAGASIESAAYQ